MKTIVLIGYKKRSGKDTMANIINKLIPNSTILRFSDSLKDILSVSLNIPVEELDKLKNNNEKLKWNCGEISFRQLLQRFGTEAMKPVFGNDIWAKLLHQKILNLPNEYIIVPDFRFLSEYLYFINNTKYNVISIKVNRDICENTDSHISENELNDFNFDYEINNNSTLEEFDYTITNFLVPKIIQSHKEFYYFK